MKLSSKEIVKALLLHKETLPNQSDWNGTDKTELVLGSFKLKFKANKTACESVIAKYEKNYTTPNFQGALDWAWRNTRNYKQKDLTPQQYEDYNFTLI